MGLIPHKPVFPYPLRRDLPITVGLQAWYSLAEGNAGDIYDSVGGASATLRNQSASSAWVSGPAGYALQLLFASSGYLDTSRSAFGGTELFADSAEQFTVLLRANPANMLGMLVSRGGLGGTFGLLAAAGFIQVTLRGTSTPIDGIDGDWHDYVITWDGSTARAYVDAQLAATPAVGAEAKQANDLIVGAADSGAPGVFLDAGVDLLGVWDRALDATEIAWLRLNAYGLTSPKGLGVRALAGLLSGGGHLLVRWSGDRLPIPSIDGSTSRSAEIVGHMHASQAELVEFPHVTHDEDVVYHYATVQVSGGGKRGKLQVDEVLTRVYDKGVLVDLLPNTPSCLSVSATPDLRPILRWIYSGKRERALPIRFDVFQATRSTDFNFDAPLASVTFKEEQSQYEWVGAPLSVGEERFYTVRAVTAGGVSGLIPRVALSPSSSYTSVDRFQTARLRIPDSTPEGVTDLVGEAL